MFKVAIAGRPNVGKTSVFNTITGRVEKTGNWEGVTVEVAKAKMLFHKNVEVFDVPGLLNIECSNSSIDQEIARHFLTHEKFDLVVNVVSPENLQEELQLTIQLYELGVPVLIVINDYKKRMDSEFAFLDCPVIHWNSKERGAGRKIIDRIASLCGKETSFSMDAHAIKMGYSVQPSFSNDDPTSQEEIYKCRRKVISAAIQQIKPHVISGISQRIESILTARFLALPIFIALMCIVLSSTILVGDVFKPVFESAVQYAIIEPLKAIVKVSGGNKFIYDIVEYGVGSGIKTVVSFIPLLFTLYIFLGIIEESGYITSISSVIGKLVSKFGLSPKSIIPLIVGFGCNVPAVIATRIIPDKRERILTIFLIPFMSCGARLTVFVLFATIFFKENSYLIICALYFFSIFIALITLFILQPLVSQRVITTSNSTVQYRMPQILRILKHSLSKIKSFILDTGKTITLVSLIIYVLTVIPSDIKNWNFNISDGEINQNSILVNCIKEATHLFNPIGIEDDNWPAVVGLLTGVLAKEVVTSTLVTLYEAKDGEIGNHKVLIAKYFKTDAAVFSYLLFILIYFPCISVFAVMKKEAGFMVAFLSGLLYTVLAYLMSSGFYKIANHFEGSILMPLGILSCIVVIVAIAARLLLISYKRLSA